jgi:GT2 family glycosyltransferase
MDVGQTDIHPGGSVVVCAFSLERVHQTVACVESVLGQRAAPAQVLVVVDHNDTLQAMLRARLPTTVQVIANSGPRGLASARNTGVQACHYDPIVFIDDDAVANENWLETLLAAFDDPEVIGAGGHAVPRWESEQPRWLPDELLWVVGCSYRGLPRAGAVRNPLGCNMAFRSAVFKQAGPFDPAIGRLGTRPLGCEETELCIRAVRRLPAGKFVLVPGANVEHAVASRRGRPGYLLRRCFYEGVSKALVCKLGDTRSLDTERNYVRRVLRERVRASTKAALSGTEPIASIGQIGAVVGALIAAAIGYLVGTVVFAVRPPAPARVTDTHSCEAFRSFHRIRHRVARKRSRTRRSR